MNFVPSTIHQTRGHAGEFFSSPLAYPRTLAFLFLGVIAALLDAWSTLAMMSTGLFEEANPLAAYGMGSVGVELYVAAATLVSLCFPLLIFVRSESKVWLALPAVGILFVAYKLYTGLSNIVLWWG